MSPSTNTPQDWFKNQRSGTFACGECNVHDKGGQREFYDHWLREHYDSQPPSGLIENIKIGGNVL